MYTAPIQRTSLIEHAKNENKSWYLYQAWNISLILGVNSNNWIPIIKRFTVLCVQIQLMCMYVFIHR